MRTKPQHRSNSEGRPILTSTGPEELLSTQTLLPRLSPASQDQSLYPANKPAKAVASVLPSGLSVHAVSVPEVLPHDHRGSWLPTEHGALPCSSLWEPCWKLSAPCSQAGIGELPCCHCSSVPSHLPVKVLKVTSTENKPPTVLMCPIALPQTLEPLQLLLMQFWN